MPSKFEKAQKAMLKVRDAKNRAWSRYAEKNAEFTARCRDYLKAAGWIEESRYDGRCSWKHVYKRPTGSTWHTLRGALEAERKRQVKARRKRGA